MKPTSVAACAIASRSLFIASLAGAIALAAGAAQAGQCYRQVETAPVYATQVEQQLVRPAASYARTIPAVWQNVSERVMVEPARQIARTVPAVYATVNERVMIEPERAVTRLAPAIVRHVAEQVMVSPGRKVWQETREHGRIVGCWVHQPATYATRMRAVEVEPARTLVERIPAVWGVRARTVETQPARTVYETIPAVYATHTRAVEVQPARTVHETTPAEYRAVTRQILVRAGERGWAPIDRNCNRVSAAY